jgi:flagellar basal body P-ring formation protein FlgA
MIMIVRRILLTAALLAATTASAFAQASGDTIASPVLRADVTVTGEVVRIGDVIDNAGTAAEIPIYRAPDLGTTGSLPTAQVIATLQAHQVIGVDTKDIKAVSVTRLSRAIDAKEIQSQIAHAIEHRGGLGDAASLSLSFDRDLQDIQLASCYTGSIQPVAVQFSPRNGRFDVTFEIGSDNNSPTVKLRFTGVVIETVEAAVLTRNVEHGEVLKASDVIVERLPKGQIGGDPAPRNAAVGMQMRRPLRAGQPLRVADLVKPDLVQRDSNVTLIYQTDGIYLTIRGKSIDSGAEGDTVNVLNLQSNRTIAGVVIGRDQVKVSVATPRILVPEVASAAGSADTAPVSIAESSNPSTALKAE